MTDEELQAAQAEAERLEKEAADKEAELKAKQDAENKPTDKSKNMTDAEAKLLKEVMAQKKAAKEAADKARALEEKYAGIDIEKLLEVARAAEEAEVKELERKGEYERLLQKQKEAHEREVAETKAKLKELKEAAAAAKKDAEAMSLANAFSNSRFVLDSLTLTPNKTKALYGEYFENENGVTVGYDKPRGSAGRTKLVDGSGEAVSFDEAMKQIIEADPDKETLIKSNLNGGAGSMGNRGEFKPSSKDKPMTSIDKLMQGLKDSKLI